MASLGLISRTLLLVTVFASQGEHRATIDVQAIELRAQGLPPQFAAYSLLHAAPGVTAPEVLAVLRVAFDYAKRAPDEFARVSGAPMDSLEAREAIASQLGLSRVALQTDIVARLLKIDPGVARELFVQIDVHHDSGSCREDGLLDLSKYYLVATALADRGFSPDEREHLEHIAFAQRVLDAKSSAQLRGAILFASNLHTFRSPGEVAALANGIKKALRNPEVIDTEGFGLLSRTVSDVGGLIRRWPAHDADLRGALLEYLKAQGHEPRCARNAVSERWPDAQELARWNRVICGADGPNCQERLTAAQLTPKTSLTAHKISPFWKTPEAIAALNCVNRVFAVRKGVSTAASNLTDPAEGCLDLVDSWKSKPGHNPSTHEKLTLLERMTLGLPPGDQRVRGLRLFVGVLDTLDEGGTRPQIWVWYARRVPKFRTDSATESLVVDTFVSGHPELDAFVTTSPRGR
jgi:hypothetical protein